MKKYICFGIVMFLYTILLSQGIRDSINKSDYKWKYTIEKQDDEERRNADYNPIIKKTYDTLGYDYLEQHFYHNGNLYYQIPYVNGKKNGIYEEYHPNGQLYNVDEYKDGIRVNDSIGIYFDRFGDTSSYTIVLPYRRELYSFGTSYFYGSPSHLDVFKNKHLVAEFCYDEHHKKWKKRDYHIRSVKYAKKLLKVYLKNKK